MRSLENVSIVLTGATGGMGIATALQIARPRVNLAICSLHSPKLEELSRRLTDKGATVYSHVVNVTREEQVQSFMEDAADRFGKLDMLLNFAGLSVTAKITELAEEAYDQVMDVNVKGMFFSIKHFLPHVDEEKGALIVNVGSMASKRPNPSTPHYCAAKAAVNVFAQGLAEQLKGKNIRITTINPGPTDTTFFEGRIPKEKRTKFMKAEDIAEVIEFVLTRDSRIVFHDIMFDSFEYFKG